MKLGSGPRRFLPRPRGRVSLRLQIRTIGSVASGPSLAGPIFLWVSLLVAAKGAEKGQREPEKKLTSWQAGAQQAAPLPSIGIRGGGLSTGKIALLRRAGRCFRPL